MHCSSAILPATITRPPRLKRCNKVSDIRARASFHPNIKSVGVCLSARARNETGSPRAFAATELPRYASFCAPAWNKRAEVANARNCTHVENAEHQTAWHPRPNLSLYQCHCGGFDFSPCRRAAALKLFCAFCPLLNYRVEPCTSTRRIRLSDHGELGQEYRTLETPEAFSTY